MRMRKKQVSSLACALFNKHTDIDECIAIANKYIQEAEERARAECAADTRRLDWMADNQCQFLNFGPREGDDRAVADCMGNVLATNSDIRKAIDAAMEGGK